MRECAHHPLVGSAHTLTSEPGSRGSFEPVAGVDLYAWPHNETSTGVSTEVTRVTGADDGALMVVDATSAAGGIDFDARNADVYYFAPQKNFASDGGLWFALMSPAAIARAAEIADTDRYIPDFLSLTQAIDNSRLHQTLNTPSLTTLLLMEAQLEWMLSLGGLSATAAHCHAASTLLYDWAESRSDVTPFVANPAHRSPVVVTLDLAESVDATALTQALRANGVVDTEPYRKLGRNQIRVATFAGVPHSDVEKTHSEHRVRAGATLRAFLRRGFLSRRLFCLCLRSGRCRGHSFLRSCFLYGRFLHGRFLRHRFFGSRG